MSQNDAHAIPSDALALKFNFQKAAENNDAIKQYIITQKGNGWE